MMHRLLILAVVLVALAAPVAFAAGWSVPVPGHPAAVLDNIYIPAAWAGIWSYTDSTYDCGISTPTSDDSDIDTLCTGTTYSDSDTSFQCSGNIDDNTADITCSGSFEFLPGCSVTITIHSVANRSGDSYSETTTTITEYMPALCAFNQPNSCKISNRHATRTGPPPAMCSTAALPTTWGGIKAIYR